jgi:hypothetical protein
MGYKYLFSPKSRGKEVSELIPNLDYYTSDYELKLYLHKRFQWIGPQDDVFIPKKNTIKRKRMKLNLVGLSFFEIKVLLIEKYGFHFRGGCTFLFAPSAKEKSISKIEHGFDFFTSDKHLKMFLKRWYKWNENDAPRDYLQVQTKESGKNIKNPLKWNRKQNSNYQHKHLNGTNITSYDLTHTGYQTSNDSKHQEGTNSKTYLSKCTITKNEIPRGKHNEWRKKNVVHDIISNTKNTFNCSENFQNISLTSALKNSIKCLGINIIVKHEEAMYCDGNINDKKQRILTFIKRNSSSLQTNRSSFLYICGRPGTGKVSHLYIPIY